MAVGYGGARVAATPLARTLAKEKGIGLINVKGTGSRGEIKARDVEDYKAVSAAPVSVTPSSVTPLARRMAEALDIDLSDLKGSGHEGKIKKADLPVENKMPVSTKAVIEGSPQDIQPESPKDILKPLKGMRKIIADRMLKSHREAPPVTLHAKADVTELAALRKQMKEIPNTGISLNDFVLKAAAMALSEMSGINVSIEGEEIVYKKEINIGMAVALEEGLIVPVLRNTDTLSLRQISDTSKDLSQRARSGKLLPEEIRGGTFTVSNLGMYGITAFTPIINPPESAILGVCAIENVLKMIEGNIENRSMMGLCLTIDHRVIDGAQGALFLSRIKALLENPLELLL